MANPHGGTRPGAGRKTKAEKFARPIAAAEKRIADKLPSLIDNLLELAGGVTVQEIDKDGDARVYSRPPDFKANEYLINRILGRPTEHVDATSAGEKIQVVGFDVIAPLLPPQDDSDGE